MTFRRVLLVAGYIVLIGGGILLSHLLSQWAIIDVRPANEPEIHRMLMLVALLFVLVSALPFVPGAEIGLALMAVFGSPIVPLVYFCMLLALILAYCVGRFVPTVVTAKFFGFVGLERARALTDRMVGLNADERARLLIGRSSSRFVPFLVKHRYVALALAFNVPGNTVLGGGGGLALVAGMSGLFSWPGFMVTAALAIAPIPLLILLTAYQP